MALSVVATLAGITFHGWKDSIHDPSNVGERFARLGQKGSGSQITGVSSPETTYDAWIACSSLADANAAANSVEALPFTTVALVDQFGVTFPRVRITKAMATIRRGKGTAVSGAAGMTHLVECSIALEVLP